MSTFDDPNREAVGLPPIWAETEPAPEAAKAKPAKKSESKAKSGDDGDD